MKIKFITLNIWHGGKFFNSLIRFIEEQGPDITTLQEAYPKTIDALMQKFPEYEKYFAPAFFDLNDNVDRGNAIFSRFPIVRSENIFFDLPYAEVKEELPPGDYTNTPRNLAHSLVKAEKIDLNIFNIHGIWGFDGYDNERRLKMGKTVLNAIKDKENVILAGDFNLRPNNQTVYNIEKSLKNVFKGELKTTFNMGHKIDPGYADSVVDMIFVSPNIKVLDHYCPQVDISDHFPLVAVLEI